MVGKINKHIINRFIIGIDKDAEIRAMKKRAKRWKERVGSESEKIGARPNRVANATFLKEHFPEVEELRQDEKKLVSSLK